MKQKTRLTLLLICVVLFLVFTPYIILYSLGYRVDFTHLKIVATGGIYVKAEPSNANIVIDDNPISSKGFFADYVFTQNLLPGPHSVAINKEGYASYQKTLPVVEKEVTKLEHVLLFKNAIPFQAMPEIPATTTEP